MKPREYSHNRQVFFFKIQVPFHCNFCVHIGNQPLIILNIPLIASMNNYEGSLPLIILNAL